MKHFFFFLTLLGFQYLKAQSPQGINYQAIARNASGALVANAPVGVRISILDQSPTGTVLYAETHQPNTNANGSFSLVIGQGTVSSGTFASISWGNQAKFLQVEYDPGTQQLMSVPYALYAEKTTHHYVGELFGGGVVFYVYKDQTGEHGLIASLEDLSAGTEWGDINIDVPGAESKWDGFTNTQEVLAFGTLPGSPFDLVSSYSAGGFTDWYIPAEDELKLMIQNSFHINKVLTEDGNPATNGFGFSMPGEYAYWSSTETEISNVYVNGNYGEQLTTKQLGGNFLVRAIRKF